MNTTEVYTEKARHLLHQADTLGYEVRISEHGDLLAGVVEHVVVRLIPNTDHARNRLRLAGREDRILEAAARTHPDRGMRPFAVEAALSEVLQLHADTLGLVIL